MDHLLRRAAIYSVPRDSRSLRRLPKECGRHPTQVLVPPPQDFQRGEHREITRLPRSRGHHWPLFVPPGTPVNCPPLQRWDHLSLAVRSPDRGDRNSYGDFCGFETTAARSRHSWESAVPDGTCRFIGIAFPPLKRWATVGCPCRDKVGSFLWKNGPVQPCPGEAEELLEAEGFLRRMATTRLRKSGGMFPPAARARSSLGPIV